MSFVVGEVVKVNTKITNPYLITTGEGFLGIVTDIASDDDMHVAMLTYSNGTPVIGAKKMFEIPSSLRGYAVETKHFLKTGFLLVTKDYFNYHRMNSTDPEDVFKELMLFIGPHIGKLKSQTVTCSSHISVVGGPCQSGKAYEGEEKLPAPVNDDSPVDIDHAWDLIRNCSEYWRG